MELYAKGQLSFLILTCMQDRDFYGLDIISEITARSNGRINLKKPSVYSNLTRMEKQGYISSYLKSSDFGPNRKYYSLTEKGREFYRELNEYFERNNIDVFKDFNDGETPSPSENISIFESPKEAVELSVEEQQPEIGKDNENEDFFDFSSIQDEQSEESNQTEEETVEEIEDENVIEEVMEKEEVPQIQQTAPSPAQNDTYSLRGALMHKEEPAAEKKDDGVFLTQQNADEYNKRLYDISKDINKYKKKRSFAEDQISMTTTDALTASQEKSKTNIEDFKNSILGNKNRSQDYRLNQDDFARQMNYRFERNAVVEKQKQEEEVKDDAVYITNRVDASTVERAKKIEPPRLKVVSETTFKEAKLPAPKRDTTIDPSHKEILTQLYSRTKDNASPEEREFAIYDYNDLKDYYSNQNIDFNVYKKPTHKIKHNTNKLYMIVSLITFLLSAFISGLTFISLLKTDMLNNNTNFLFILLPAILILDLIIKIHNYKKFSGWLPKKILPQWAIWLIFIGVCGIIFAINFAFGMRLDNFGLYATTTVLTAVFTFVVVVVRYYIKRYALVKYWK